MKTEGLLQEYSDQVRFALGVLKW